MSNASWKLALLTKKLALLTKKLALLNWPYKYNGARHQ